MSRANKENSNRRQYNIMSAEEVAAGKKSYWSEMEITGAVKNLSPDLWQFTHLTALYMNDNNLTRLSGDISLLINLRTLDISNNKLRYLPSEIGDLIYLRELCLNNNNLRTLPYELGKFLFIELCLNNNNLRTLPYELGKLFQIQILGLHGNPLSKDYMKIYNEPNGTQKLLSYLLDSLQG
ncbi:CCR4-NOT transcription complex subunit 6-like [Diaphorina citri]|uniref:CCR4-NOT transcription complex subunit 6-like n=1 Tax=Diaphorina citri TaxID=121845 RepID=A0A3Q0IX75_DIACI|nr:CCR4-NOT transcription complex subunit 6-like [Diaphorina citri]